MLTRLNYRRTRKSWCARDELCHLHSKTKRRRHGPLRSAEFACVLPLVPEHYLEAVGSTVTAKYGYGNALIHKDGEYPLFDGLGSERHVTNSSQTVTGTLNTDAFGNTVGTTGSSSSPYMFGATSGYRTDGDAGLLHVGARYYDPQVGRFISRDSYLDQHPYLYCGHDPANRLDPQGHLDDSVSASIRNALANPNPHEALEELETILESASEPRDVGATQKAINAVRLRFNLSEYISNWRQGSILRQFPSYDKYKDMPVKQVLEILKKTKIKDYNTAHKLLTDGRFAK